MTGRPAVSRGGLDPDEAGRVAQEEGEEWV